jgi:hypothetical protein
VCAFCLEILPSLFGKLIGLPWRDFVSAIPPASAPAQLQMWGNLCSECRVPRWKWDSHVDFSVYAPEQAGGSADLLPKKEGRPQASPETFGGQHPKRTEPLLPMAALQLSLGLLYFVQFCSSYTLPAVPLSFPPLPAGTLNRSLLLLLPLRPRLEPRLQQGHPGAFNSKARQWGGTETQLSRVHNSVLCSPCKENEAAWFCLCF